MSISRETEEMTGRVQRQRTRSLLGGKEPCDNGHYLGAGSKPFVSCTEPQYDPLPFYVKHPGYSALLAFMALSLTASGYVMLVRFLQ